MTFTEIVDFVAKALNRTSTDAYTRIGQSVNIKYRELVAKPWMQISKRGVAEQAATIGSRYITFSNVTKLYSLFDPSRADWVLEERGFQEMRNMLVGTDPPTCFAISRQSSRSVTVFMESVAASAYTLLADVEQHTVTLVGDQEPQFDEDFHSILIAGGKYLEYLHMEKPQMAEEAREEWERLLSDLKFHNAKTSYLNYLQGKSSQNYPAFINTIVTP